MTLKAALAEIIRHAKLTDQDLLPGTIWSYICEDVKLLPSVLQRDAAIEKFDRDDLISKAGHEHEPFYRASLARKAGTPMPKFQEVPIKNFILKYLETHVPSEKKAALKKHQSINSFVNCFNIEELLSLHFGPKKYQFPQSEGGLQVQNTFANKETAITNISEVQN